jgi:hypothetical protein
VRTAVFFSGPRNLSPADRLDMQRRNRETGSRVLEPHGVMPGRLFYAADEQDPRMADQSATTRWILTHVTRVWTALFTLAGLGAAFVYKPELACRLSCGTPSTCDGQILVGCRNFPIVET